MHVLTTQAQVTASGIFPWSDWSTWSTLSVNETRSQQSAGQSARAACNAVVSMTLCGAHAGWHVNKPGNNSRTTPAWQLDHVNPAYSLRRHTMIMIIKIMITIMIKIIIVTMIKITITTMVLSFNHGYHWRNGCPELNYVYNCIVGWYMFRKRSKAHRHILFILLNIERRDLIAIYFGPP